MAEGMRLKFEKYWGSYEKLNFLLFVAMVLDPRRKLLVVEYCFEKVYELSFVKALMDRLKEKLNDLYEWYVKNDSNANNESNLNEELRGMDVDGDDARAFFDLGCQRRLEHQSSIISKNEMERYLIEACEINSVDFDVLGWWKINSTKYPIVSQIARDVLAIPVSTVASESAFSTGGRVLDPFRSSLSANTVEALICTQNWLRSSSSPVVMGEIEQLEMLESVNVEGPSAESILIED